MNVKFVTTAAGPSGTYISGSVHIVPDDFGADLVSAGHAINLDPVVPETAEIAPVETTALPTAKGRGRK